MKYQSKEYYCGPAALACALRSLGENVGQTALAKLAGTSDAGTDDDGLKRAILAKGYVFEECNLATRVGAYNWLCVKMKLGFPVLLCVQRWEHWVTACGMLGDRFVLFDPARFEYRIKAGIQVANWNGVAKKWYAPKQVRGKLKPYYGLSVMPSAR